MPFPTRHHARPALHLAIGLALVVGLLITAGHADAAAKPEWVRGWALIGDDRPVVGATVILARPDGRVIQGARDRTGLSGEFMIDLDEVAVPRRVVVVVYGGSVADEENLPGRLRADVSMRGPAGGLVYVTPLSTLSMALRDRHPSWTRARADREAQRRLGIRPLPDATPAFAPWRDGGAFTKYDKHEIDPDVLDEEIDQAGGFTKWERKMMRGSSFPRRPSTGTATRAAPDPFGLYITATWTMAVSAAKSCKSTQELFERADFSVQSTLSAGKNPFSDAGRIGYFLRDQNIVEQDPACRIPALDQKLRLVNDSLSESITRLEVLNGQLTGVSTTLSEQNERLVGLRQTINRNASSNAVITFSGTEAAILTLQANTLALTQRLQTRRAALGLSVEEIFTSTDPRVVAVAESLREYAREEAAGPRIANWPTAYSTFTQPGVVLPGNNSKGLLGLTRDALAGSGLTPAQQRAELIRVTTYYQSLYRILMVQQIDAWRIAGVPETVIERNVERRRAFDQRLETYARSR